jgi:hypothetical protein
MVAASNLMKHCGARDVQYDELASMPVPPGTDTWFPIGHSRVYDAIVNTLGTVGMEVARTRLAVSNKDARFFGVLDLTHKVVEGVTLAVGIRNSVDKSFPIGFCAGTRVFVCDNLAFTAEEVVTKKHTRFGETRFLEGISKAVLGLQSYQKTETQRIADLQAWELSEDAANSYMLQAYEKNIVSTRILPLVIKEWREPKYDEFAPRTAWSLWNAFTDAIGQVRQKSNPASAAHSTIRLQKLLAPPVVAG